MTKESSDVITQKISECSVYKNKNCPPVNSLRNTLKFLSYIDMHTTDTVVYSVFIHIHLSLTNNDSIYCFEEISV